MNATTLLEMKNVKKVFPQRQGFWQKQIGGIRAVDGVSLAVKPGETLGLVGESGCGKSTLGRMVVNLIKPTAGEFRYRGDVVNIADKKQVAGLRKKVQMIFQDPFSSLNPRQKVGDILEEPFCIHDRLERKERKELVVRLLEKVGLDAGHAARYPHEFSGGQRQRIGIARALALNPEMIVCDEPVSALDVSVQSQVINLLNDLQAEFGIAYLFIAHDLGVVRHISHRVAVMYLGNIVEVGAADTLFTNPGHPYTRLLLDSIPANHPRVKKERLVLQNDVPNPANPPAGCKFHTRCPDAQPLCREETPALRSYGDHSIACHMAIV
ncbi:MAG TPA: dipeptide ABC transporter ATP-binding protein [Desulfotomaculum sp.]|nr:MAG: hypothetical protein JL56_17210 [Desulfotomaculum sp. BICA1-6]HBX22276.1 dipeptide ABC transporter ATP-binding protein [Desulfotomaculum sp.]